MSSHCWRIILKLTFNFWQIYWFSLRWIYGVVHLHDVGEGIQNKALLVVNTAQIVQQTTAVPFIKGGGHNFKQQIHLSKQNTFKLQTLWTVFYLWQYHLLVFILIKEAILRKRNSFAVNQALIRRDIYKIAEQWQCVFYCSCEL